jgi:DNA invertase Pin-like site-specific DNA recombinase
MNTGTRKVISYLRASTNEAMQRNSIEIQRRLIQEFCSRHNYQIIEEFAEYASGRSNERVQFNRALEKAQAENLLVVFHRVDRISRNLSVFSQLEPMLHLIRAVELGDQPINLLTLSILISIATQESINTSTRVSASIKHLKEQAGDSFVWGNPNIGSLSGKGVSVRQSNAKLHNDYIRQVCDELKMAGYSNTMALTKRLNELNIKTRRGSEYTYRNLRRVLASSL